MSERKVYTSGELIEEVLRFSASDDLRVTRPLPENPIAVAAMRHTFNPSARKSSTASALYKAHDATRNLLRRIRR
jgi:hypothetical protein